MPRGTKSNLTAAGRRQNFDDGVKWVHFHRPPSSLASPILLYYWWYACILISIRKRFRLAYPSLPFEHILASNSDRVCAISKHGLYSELTGWIMRTGHRICPVVPRWHVRAFRRRLVGRLHYCRGQQNFINMIVLSFSLFSFSLHCHIYICYSIPA